MGYTLSVSPDTEVSPDNNTHLSCMCDFQSSTSSLYRLPLDFPVICSTQESVQECEFLIPVVIMFAPRNLKS